MGKSGNPRKQKKGSGKQCVRCKKDRGRRKALCDQCTSKFRRSHKRLIGDIGLLPQDYFSWPSYQDYSEDDIVAYYRSLLEELDDSGNNNGPNAVSIDRT